MALNTMPPNKYTLPFVLGAQIGMSGIVACDGVEGGRHRKYKVSYIKKYCWEEQTSFTNRENPFTFDCRVSPWATGSVLLGALSPGVMCVVNGEGQRVGDPSVELGRGSPPNEENA